MSQNPSYAEIEVIISNRQGLHARPAMKFVDTAARFASSVKVINGKVEVDGKSPMEMMLLEAVQGTKIKLRADGADCKEALDALAELISSKFGEE
jgi:phosphocarrier protein HPr